MPFIVETVRILLGGRIERVPGQFMLLKSADNILIKDKRAVICPLSKSALSEQSPFIRICQENAGRQFVENISSKDIQIKDRLWQRNEKIFFSEATEIIIDDLILRIYCLSSQAWLYSKINNYKLIGAAPAFRLSCDKAGVDLGLYPFLNISLGSSQFDSIEIDSPGLKPRHLNLILGQNIKDSRVEACLGRVEIKRSPDSLTFEAVNSALIFRLESEKQGD